MILKKNNIKVGDFGGFWQTQSTGSLVTVSEGLITFSDIQIKRRY